MIPHITAEQASKLDELMVSHFKVPVVMMMEQAGYRLAEFARLKFSKKKNILVCAGKGNNGGDGLAAARHLKNFGYSPRIFLVTRKLKNEPKMHYEIARKLKIPVFSSLEKLKESLNNIDAVYDCLIGYNLRGAPRGKFDKAIWIINNSKKPVIACDIPSGVDADKGAIYENHIKPAYILSLSLPKKGCKGFLAKNYVADIGVPKGLYPKIGIKARNYFESKAIIKI